MKVRSGTSRSVILTKRWALKLPWGLGRRPVRGWLANQSEWRQRHRLDVCRPRWTLGHCLLVMPRAQRIATHDGEVPTWVREGATTGDEGKPSSWGWFGDRWLLVDYDRSWEQPGRGLVGRAGEDRNA